MSIADTHGHRHEPEPDDETIAFEPDAVRDWIDSCIRLWRRKRDEARTGSVEDMEMAEHYVDAYQSMRTSLFGETLPIDPDPVTHTVAVELWKRPLDAEPERVAFETQVIDNLSRVLHIEHSDHDGTRWIVKAQIRP